MFNCRKYFNFPMRLKRCDELGICGCCSSARHRTEVCSARLDYPCSICSKRDHISALCPKFTKVTTNICASANLSYKGSNFLLPTVTIKAFHGDRSGYIRLLIDSGSQRSYIKTSALDRIGYPTDGHRSEFLIGNFFDKRRCDLSESLIEFCIGNNVKKFRIPFLLEESFELQFDIGNLPDLISNIKKDHRMADSTYECKPVGTSVHMEGILGTDNLDILGD